MKYACKYGASLNLLNIPYISYVFIVYSLIHLHSRWAPMRRLAKHAQICAKFALDDADVDADDVANFLTRWPI